MRSIRPERQDHVVAGGDDGGRQHRMVALDLAVGALARLTVRAAELLRAEIFGSIERDQRASAQALESLHAAVVAQRRHRGIENALQMIGMHRIEHRADMIVGWDLRHPEQRLAIGGLLAFLERLLMRKERLRLHEEQRKRRKSNVRHRIAALALPLVGKGGARIFQAANQMVEDYHPDLESENRFRE
jgi:hypothetical protein